MNEFKQGERVKVEFEALALPESSIAGDSWLLVGIPGTQLATSVRKEHCTLIEPEIILPEIPGTIVQVDPADKLDQRATFVCAANPRDDTEIWAIQGKWFSTERVVELCRKYGYRVIEAVTE